MIPAADLEPTIPRPLPQCRVPEPHEITEEGFGYFRGTWRIDRVPVADAQAVIEDEALLIALLDAVALTGEEYESLATGVEAGSLDGLPPALRARALKAELATSLPSDDDIPPLFGLEIGVAGLACALSMIWCRAAASCRSHVDDRSWSDCPVVFFVAPEWRLELLAPLIERAGCGLGADRDMLTVYGRSIRDTHNLARLIVEERSTFRARPQHKRRVTSTGGSKTGLARDCQQQLFS